MDGFFFQIEAILSLKNARLSQIFFLDTKNTFLRVSRDAQNVQM